MFERSGAIVIFAALLLTTGAVTDSNAGERMRRHFAGKPVRVVVNINVRQRQHMSRQFNTYSGDAAIRYRRNVGTWSYGTVSGRAETLATQPKVKIIDVNTLGGKADCSMEHGVCVIRP